MVFSLPLTALAADNYNMNINEPAKGDNQGYILLLIEGPSGTRQVQCISWTLLPLFTNNEVTYNASEMMIDVSNSSSVVSFGGRSVGNYQMSAGFGRSLSGDSQRTTYWSVWANSTGVNYNYSLGSNKVLGYQVYGNGVVESHDLGSNNNVPFSVSWGDDAKSVSLMTEILAELSSMSDDVGTLITQIYEIIANDEEALLLFNDILVELSDQGLTLDNIEYRLNIIFNYVASINDRMSYVKSYLKDILKILEGSGESSFVEPNTEGISEYDKAEDELISGADDTSDIEQQIEDFEIDANSSAKIWDIITQFFTSHPKIMGLVIGMLCLGIIALILNR